jgi:transposase
MAVIALARASRRALEAIVARPRESRQYRRAQALLWLAEGERPTAVARRLRVHRDTIDEWAKRFRERGLQPLATCLRDRTRTGRPRQLAEMVARGIVTMIDTDPQAQGYRAAQWTAPLLRRCLRDQQALAVSAVTVRRCLHRLGCRWKRPRYVLARRPPYRRQAKGGSSAASRVGVGRGCSCWTKPSSLKRRRCALAGPEWVSKPRCPSPATTPGGSSTAR